VGRFTIVSCSIFFATTSGLNIPEVSEISLVSSGCKKRQKLYVNKQNNNYTTRHDMTINYKKYTATTGARGTELPHTLFFLLSVYVFIFNKISFP
jgi:hypothetical protein